MFQPRSRVVGYRDLILVKRRTNPSSEAKIHLRAAGYRRRSYSTTASSNAAVKVQYAQSVFQDPTLAWAQQNPQLAQACLNPPPADVEDCNAECINDATKSIEGYLQWRNWRLPGQLQRDDGDDTESAIALVSHVLSAPLTLANGITIGSLNSTNQDDSAPSRQQNWCCVGARAEATLPAHYWKEFLVLTSSQSSSKQASSDNSLQMTLQFTGPDIPPKFPEQTLDATSSGSIALQGGFRGLYHESPGASSSEDNDRDGFVLFNPGCAHPNHVADWERTLDMILKKISRQTAPCTLLLTAHSAKDAERDFALLKDTFGLDLDYQENPFASRVCYQDPFDPAHIVRPNHFVATWTSSA